MIKLYYHPAPNPAKVALFLENDGSMASTHARPRSVSKR